MAIDTANERLALMEFDQVYEPGLPNPSGDATIDQGDQQQMMWDYPGILWVSLTASVGSVEFPNIWMFIDE